MTDNQKASLSWHPAPIWHPVTNFINFLFNYPKTVVGLLMWGVFFDVLLLGLASTFFLGSEFLWIHDHILMIKFETPPLLGRSGSCIYFHQE